MLDAKSVAGYTWLAGMRAKQAQVVHAWRGGSVPEFATECEVFDRMAQHLASPALSDLLDSLGFRDQGLPVTLRPLSRDAVVVGCAMPIPGVAVFEIPHRPYQTEIEVVDSLKADDVLVAYAPATASAMLMAWRPCHKTWPSRRSAHNSQGRPGTS
jgi:hypothetical protein